MAVPTVIREAISDNLIIPHCLSAETVFLNLGGTTDFIRPKLFGLGLFLLSEC